MPSGAHRGAPGGRPPGLTLSRLLRVPVTAVRDAGAQHGYRHLVATFGDGRQAFVKAADSADDPGEAEAFAAEANGLRWLAEANGAPVPEVLASTGDLVAIEYLPPGRATLEAAEDFGAALARTHAAGAPSFGAPWPGRIASLPLDNTLTPATTGWGEWWQERLPERGHPRAAEDPHRPGLRGTDGTPARSGGLPSVTWRVLGTDGRGHRPAAGRSEGRGRRHMFRA